MPHPRQITTVHVESLNAELCVYDWQRCEVHTLNPTAARVWHLCDGQTSPARMAAVLQTEFALPEADEVVWLALAQLSAARLLAEPLALPAGRAPVSRRQFLKVAGLAAAALLPSVTSLVAPTPLAAQSVMPTATAQPTAVQPTAVPGGSQAFAFTGAAQQFIVPAGVTSVTINAAGASGRFIFASPGQGGLVSAKVAVTPGETLFVYVGGSPDYGQNGYNGGGNNAGGASDVRQGGNGLANRILVAGGGGGPGRDVLAGVGGHGGYPRGTNGDDLADPGQTYASGGKGGTDTAGGAGGSGNSGADGNPGTLGQGGISANGGGGGGGYYGGGSGEDYNSTGGGGGGGASFCIPSATDVFFLTGSHSGNGSVTISW